MTTGLVSADDVKAGRMKEYSETFVSQSLTNATVATLALTKGTNRSVKEIAVYINSYVAGTGTIITFYRSDAASPAAAAAIGEIAYDASNVLLLDRVYLESTALKLKPTATCTAQFTVRYYHD